MYEEAKPAQRVLAYIIDIAIMAIVVTIFFVIISNLSSHKYPKTEMDAMLDYIKDNEDVTIKDYPGYNAVMDLLSKWISSVILPCLLFYYVMGFVYFVIVPYYWEKQTIGRLVTKIKMISQINGQKPTLGQFAVRELAVNMLLIPILISVSYGILIIVAIIIIVRKRKTITDYLAKSTTYVISDSFVEVSSINPDDYNDSNYHDPSKTIDEETSKSTNGFNDDEWN